MKQMPERSETVTVRRLPDGAVRPALMESLERHQLLLAPLGDEPSPELETGALIEIQSDDAIFLGEILRRQDSQMVIAVEHAINREALAEIEDAWRSPQEG